MKNTIVALAIMAASVTGANATTIDFDDLSEGTSVGATYADLGVTFVDAMATDNFGLLGSSGGFSLKHSTWWYNALPDYPITAIFSTAVSSVSLTGIDVGAAGFRFLAYDALGDLVDSASVIGTTISGVDEYFTLTLTGTAIASVAFSQENDRIEGILFDDFSFEQVAAVPVPASLPLLGFALGGLVVARRRKTKS